MKSVIKKSVLLFVIVLLNACSGPDEEKLVLGVHSWPGGGMVYVGLDQGFFKEEGIEIEVQKIENFDTKRASLISGNIDMDVANTLDQLVIYADNGFPARVIGVTDESTGGDGLVAINSITSLEELKGKSVAFAEASPSDFFLRYLLSKNGIPIDSVVLKPVADPQIAGTAMISKQVDAAVTYEPFLSQAANTDGVNLLISTADYPKLIPGLLIANGKLVDENKNLYKRFLRAWFKSADYYFNNQQASFKIIAKEMGLEESEVAEILSVVTIQKLEDNRQLFNQSEPDNLIDLTSEISSFWLQNGFVESEAEAQSLVETSLIESLTGNE